jgi:hypothetical protein
VVEKEGSSSSGVDTEQSGVRHQRLLQIDGRAGENKRGKWGGRLVAAWRKESWREIERAPGGAIGGGSARSRRRWADE